jgi:hypothetical protein
VTFIPTNITNQTILGGFKEATFYKIIVNSLKYPEIFGSVGIITALWGYYRKSSMLIMKE